MATSHFNNARYRNRVTDGSPKTHCYLRGHDLAVVGAYPNGTCKECKRMLNRKYESTRKRERRVSRKSVQPVYMSEADRSLEILILIDMKERATTVWEREDIQNQIHALTQKVSA